MQITIVDLRPYYGFIQVSGPDGSSFLQGQLTCDVRTITENCFQLGGHCNSKGRLRALFRIYKQNEDFFLQIPLSNLSFALEELKKYAKFSKTSITDVSSTQHSLGFMGILDLEKFFMEYPIPVNTTPVNTTNPAHPSHTPYNIVKVPHEDARYQMIGSKDLIEKFLNVFPENQKMHFDAWKLADIEEGLPEVFPELREQLLPHHIQLTKLGAVSFTKGCYCGQEIIARMEYRGNIKKSMFRASISNADNIDNILPGTKIYARNLENESESLEAGCVIMATKTQERKTEMLVELSDSFVSKDSSNIKTNDALYINSSIVSLIGFNFG